MVVKTEWTAHLLTTAQGVPIGDGWKKVEREGSTRFSYDLGEKLQVTSSPKDIGEGRVHFTYPFSYITLFPQGGSKLDPGRVQGL